MKRCSGPARGLALLLSGGMGLGVTAQAWSAEPLQQCLADFGGMTWRLPYAPSLNISRCSSPSASYNADKSQNGARQLDLITGSGFDEVGPGRMQASHFVQIQQASFHHFDHLFQSQGYSRLSITEEADSDGSTYVKSAVYTRSHGDRKLLLTYECTAGNTWSLRLEGLSPAGAARP